MSEKQPNLIYYVQRMAGHVASIVRLESQNKTTARGGDILDIMFPIASVTNIRTFTVFGNATTKASEAGGTECGARMPPIDDFIERVETTLGGDTLAQGATFTNVLNSAKRGLGAATADSVLGHSEYCRKTQYIDGVELTGVTNEHYPSGAFSHFAMTKFPGYLETAEPPIQDLGVLPSLKVKLFLAPNSILTTSAGVGLGNKPGGTAVSPAGFPADFTVANGTDARYLLTDIFATVEVHTMMDQGYDMMLANQMANAGHLEISYKNYISFQEKHSGSTRWSVASQSIDRLWVMWRDETYNDMGAPIIVNGHKTKGGYLKADGTAGAADVDIGLSQYDSGILGTHTEKYKSKYFNFKAPNKAMTVQAQINGQFFPTFPANLGVLYGMTKNALEDPKNRMDLSLDQYINNYCCQVFRFNLPGSEKRRLISGIDSRNSNVSGIINTTNLGISGDNLALNLFVETTSTVRVGPNKSVQVIA